MSTYGDIGEHAAAEESNTAAHSEWMDDMVHMELTQGSWNPAFQHALRDLLHSFGHLKCLKVQEFPWLYQKDLQPIIQHKHHLRHVQLQGSTSVTNSDHLEQEQEQEQSTAAVQQLQRWVQLQMPWVCVCFTG